jgi:hypothetical protein
MYFPNRFVQLTFGQLQNLPNINYSRPSCSAPASNFSGQNFAVLWWRQFEKISVLLLSMMFFFAFKMNSFSLLHRLHIFDPDLCADEIKHAT